jgi:hypothetical protein
MKWVLSHATDEIHHWQLQHTEGSRSMIVNLQRSSIRLNGFSKRLFFLQAQGFLQKKILLRSEYGVVLGETIFSEKPMQAPLFFNGQKYFYQADDHQLLLFDSEKNLVNRTEFAALPSLDRLEFYSLLFGFAWFLTADAMAEKNRSIQVTA